MLSSWGRRLVKAQEERMKRLTGIAVAVLLGIPATVAAQTGTDDAKAIQRAADQWMAAYNAGDAAAVAKMYSEDARLSTAMGTADGRPAIEQYFKNEMAAGVKMGRTSPSRSRNASVTSTIRKAPSPPAPLQARSLVIG
jgi:ketosteroid isomerase-like protein